MATLTGSVSTGDITASGDLKTGTGNGMDDLATRLAVAEAIIANLSAIVARQQSGLYALSRAHGGLCPLWQGSCHGEIKGGAYLYSTLVECQNTCAATTDCAFYTWFDAPIITSAGASINCMLRTSACSTHPHVMGTDRTTYYLACPP